MILMLQKRNKMKLFVQPENLIEFLIKICSFDYKQSVNKNKLRQRYRELKVVSQFQEDQYFGIRNINHYSIEHRNKSNINQVCKFQSYNNYFIHLKTTMNLFLENPKISFKNNNKMFQTQGPFSISRDSTIEKPVFKHSEEWSQKQLMRFAVFFYGNYNRFNSAEKSEQWTMFKQVANFIRTRNFTQCKNQYARIMKKFGSILSFIQHLKESLNHFQIQFECYQQEFFVFQQKLAKGAKGDKSLFDQFGNPLPTALSYENQNNPVKQIFRICSMPRSIAKRFYPQLVIESQIKMNQVQICLNKLLMLNELLTNITEKN